MLGKIRNPVLAAFLALFWLVFATSPAGAAMVSSQLSSEQASGGDTRSHDMEKVRLALENKIVQEKLRAYGYTPDEIKSKLDGMTEGQIHLLAQASDDVIAGGDGIGIVIGVLVIILLIILILKLLNKKVVI